MRALILHRVPVRENDQLLDVFSREEGRLTLLAAGVRHVSSRRAGHLEPLLESELLVSKATRQESVRDARAFSAFPTLRQHLARLRLAYEIVRLLREVVPEHLPDARLYDVVRKLFGVLDQSVLPVTPLVLRSAEVHVLRHLGLLPDLAACGRCRRSLEADAFTFDSTHRSFVCAACLPAAPASALTGAVKIFRLLLDEPTPLLGLTVSAEVQTTAADLTRFFLQSVRVPEELPVR